MKNLNELIPIQENNGKKAVSARMLYEFLGYNKSAWKRWYTKNIIENIYAEENVDWQGFDIELNGNETKDFALSIPFAKKISMMSKTDKGEEAREYFLRCEQVATNNVIKQFTPLEIQMEILKSIQAQIQSQIDMNNKVDALDDKVKEIELRTNTNINYTAIVGFASRSHIDISRQRASIMGREASRLCRERGLETGKINDPRFGYVKTYPDSILKTVFKKYYPQMFN